ncbi:BTB/POZ domain-containing protein 1 [Candida viswanathii]|uniref:BTB/POZ domain-containing protein 1 n=1 Tax=Candida viswanathii TaxID=5486 RepID=A0A367YJD1_9ASCO|nr:BTB/POZ domain-containing protein 1 [Candida viswanathii]
MNKTDVPNLKNLKKDALLKRDVLGRTILHIAILVNDTDALRLITKNPEFKTILQLTDFENGWNCLHYIIFHKRIRCLKVLVDYLQQVSIQNNLFHASSPLIELLRCKDRCGNTPFHLLDNDFKDLLWFPEFIDEKNGYNLAYRYENILAEEDQQDEEKEDSEENELQRASLRSSKVEWTEKRGGSEVYVLGCNSNNQLGVGDSTDRATPSMLSHNSFKTHEEDPDSIADVLEHPRYKQMVISKNHALIVSKDGEIFSCGIGSRGRLGHGLGDMNNYFKFQRIDFFKDFAIKDAAISNNHSVVLTSRNQVYAWGLNSFNQLGVPNTTTAAKKSTHYLDNFLATPVLVSGELRNASGWLQGVKVSKIHSVAWTRNELYFWGLNVGQMGIACTHGDIEVKLQDESVRGEIRPSPKMVSLRDDIKYVSTSELCTCVVTTLNDVHVYYNYQHFKLPKIPIKGYSDKHFDLFKPRRITEAAIIKKIVTRGPEHSMILLSNGSVLSFALNVKDVKSTKYTSVWKAYDRDMVAIDIDMSTDGSVVLCTRNGSVYIKSVVSNQRKSSMSGTTLPIAITKNKFKKIENVNKIVTVTCDPKFLSFGFIRDDVDLLPLKVPKNDFFTDIESLSPVLQYTSDRKQQDLLNFDQDKNGYLASLFYPSNYGDDDDDDDFESSLASKEQAIDKLKQTYHNKYDYRKNKPVDVLSTFESQLNQELTTIIENFNNFGEESLALAFLKQREDIGERRFNAFVEFETIEDIRIGFHKEIFAERSPIFQQLLDLNDKDETLVGDNFKAIWIPECSTLKVLTKVHLLAILLLIHSIYTGDKIDIPQIYGSRHNLQLHMKSVNDEYNSLCGLFQVSHGKGAVVDAFEKLLSKQDGDVVFQLSDGEMNAHLSVLKARCAYFETIDRWSLAGETMQPDFSGVSTAQMSLILSLIYGQDPLDYFIGKVKDRDTFINEVLELIEISDQMLLFQLKSVLELAISDLIFLDNVVPLVHLSHVMSLEFVFANCCWYIYNNLELLMFDTAFTGMPVEVLHKVENELQFLNNCKLVDHKPPGESVFDTHCCLLSDFINDTQKYNEIFMSDRKGFSSFEPLIDDVYAELNKPKEPVKKRKSRKSSTVRTDIADFRQNLIKERLDKGITPEVIDDNEGFTVVGKKSKQKSPPPKPAPVIANAKPEPLVKTTAPTQPTNTAYNGLSPFSNWASKSTSSPLFAEPSSRSETPVGTPPLETPAPDWKSKAPKMKIGPVVKLSQKERKRLAAAAAASTETVATEKPKEPSNLAPWSTQATSSSPPVSQKVNALPVLGSSKTKRKSVSSHKPSQEKKSPSPISIPPSSSNTPASMAAAITPDSSFNSVYSTPSLAEVMIQESLRIEQAKIQESERKTLAEIQQEQEFAKWWEEESRRVQQEMKPSGGKKKKKFTGKKGSLPPKTNGSGKKPKQSIPATQ